MWTVLLLLLLDAPGWPARDRASRALWDVMPVARLEWLEVTGSQEQRRRCAILLNRWYAQHGDRLSRLLTDLPCISAYPEDGYGCYDLIDDYLNLAYLSLGWQRAVRRHREPWAAFSGPDANLDEHPYAVLREATRLLCADLLRRRADVAGLLEVMRRAAE